MCTDVAGGDMDGRFGAFEKFSVDGEGRIAERIGCGACIGDCGGMKLKPGDDAVRCGGLPIGFISFP